MLVRFWDQVNVRFEDLRTAPSALPDWLDERERNGDRLAVIRSGRGYASWGAKSMCGPSLEILTAAGVSCGCVDIPGLTPSAPSESPASIGRDGSLIVPRMPEASRCTYDLYPQLLR